MIGDRKLFCLNVIAFLLLSTKAFALSGTTIEEGYINCFPEAAQPKSGEFFHCEASAVAYDGRNIIIASDKPIPGRERSPVFTFPFRYMPTKMNTKPLYYLTYKPFRMASKIEDFAISPDKQYIFAITSYDRSEIKEGKDVYQMLLFWPAGKPERVAGIFPELKTAIHSPYFKIEGLAVLPGKKLLFGLREVGKTYKNFDYTIQIVSVSYQQKEGKLILGKDFKIIYDVNPKMLPLPEKVGLSSIEFDPFDNALYLLTSFENKKKMGGYLWKLPLEDLYRQYPPTPVLDQKRNPLRFFHKPEGIAVLEQMSVLILHDDDRMLIGERKPHQAPYSIVRIEKTFKSVSK